MARRNMYLETYGTRTPRYGARPTHRLSAAVATLTVAGVALLVVAPDVVTRLSGLAADALARLP